METIRDILRRLSNTIPSDWNDVDKALSAIAKIIRVEKMKAGSRDKPIELCSPDDEYPDGFNEAIDHIANLFEKGE